MRRRDGRRDDDRAALVHAFYGWAVVFDLDDRKRDRPSTPDRSDRVRAAIHRAAVKLLTSDERRVVERTVAGNYIVGTVSDVTDLWPRPSDEALDEGKARLEAVGGVCYVPGVGWSADEPEERRAYYASLRPVLVHPVIHGQRSQHPHTLYVADEPAPGVLEADEARRRYPDEYDRLVTEAWRAQEAPEPASTVTHLPR